MLAAPHQRAGQPRKFRKNPPSTHRCVPLATKPCYLPAAFDAWPLGGMADAEDLKGEASQPDAAASVKAATRANEQRRGEPAEGQSRGNRDPVEAALATAIERASAAGQWTAVEVLARELEAAQGAGWRRGAGRRSSQERKVTRRAS